MLDVVSGIKVLIVYIINAWLSMPKIVCWRTVPETRVKYKSGEFLVNGLSKTPEGFADVHLGEDVAQVQLFPASLKFLWF